MSVTGYSATRSTVTKYGTDGKIAKVTESSASLFNEVTDSTKDKTIVAWESGWAAYLSVSTATTEDPTPTLKIFAGKTDKGLIASLPAHQN